MHFSGSTQQDNGTSRLASAAWQHLLVHKRNGTLRIGTACEAGKGKPLRLTWRHQLQPYAMIQLEVGLQ
jgi:hypothetical protein